MDYLIELALEELDDLIDRDKNIERQVELASLVEFYQSIKM